MLDNCHSRAHVQPGNNIQLEAFTCKNLPSFVSSHPESAVWLAPMKSCNYIRRISPQSCSCKAVLLLGQGVHA